MRRVLGSDQAVLSAVVNPQSGATPGPYTSGWVSMRDFDLIVAVLLVGTMTATGKVDALLQQATASDGSNAKSISGKAITQLTEVGSDDDKQAIINVRSNELDVEGGFTHVRLSVSTTTAASLLAAVLLGLSARYEPESDAATVAEVVS